MYLKDFEKVSVLIYYYFDYKLHTLKQEFQIKQIMPL